VSILSCERPVLRVLVADDHELTRFSLKMALRSHSGIELVGIATNGLEAIEYTRAFCPDVVILDLQMPVMDGLSAAGKIKSICPGIQILAYSSLEDSRVDQLLRDSVIDSVCRKDTATAEIISRVKLLGKPFLVEYPVF
jgi:two-component system, NarL family, vancomycin resistance associated response regulator VraR